jgi:anthranilate phosphoribosyltransferase
MATDLVVQIVGLANAMLSYCVRVDGLDDAVDIVGTGADTVNISTGSTILAVAVSAKVAKVHHAFRRLDHRVQV